MKLRQNRYKTTGIKRLIPNQPIESKYINVCSVCKKQIEKNELISIEKDSNKFIRKFIGADEFLNNINKWCLWINDKDYSIANDVSLLKKRFDKVKEYRLKSKKKAVKLHNSEPYYVLLLLHNTLLLARNVY